MVKNQEMIKSAEFSPKMIAVIGALMAVQVVLGFLEIHTETIKISLSFIPVVMAARLYGGIGGALVAGMGDIISYIVHPVGAWFPPITITYALSGLIYGMFLYKKVSIIRVWLSVSITQLIISLFLMTLWIAMLSYKNNMMFYEFYLTMVGLRGLQAAVMTVVQIAVIPPMLKALDKIKFLKIMN